MSIVYIKHSALRDSTRVAWGQVDLTINYATGTLALELWSQNSRGGEQRISYFALIKTSLSKNREISKLNNAKKYFVSFLWRLERRTFINRKTMWLLTLYNRWKFEKLCTKKPLNLMHMHLRTGNDGHKGSTIIFQIQVLKVYTFFCCLFSIFLNKYQS